MVAVSVEKPGVLKIFEDDAPPPPPGPGEIGLRVLRAGICGSDMHILHGANPFAVYPRIIGHEFAGVIEAVGDGVDGFRIGGRVVVDPVVPCGTCPACRIGRTNVCGRLKVFGVHLDGGFRSRLTVPVANCVAVPDDMPIAVAALAEPLSIAANVARRAEIGPGDVVLVYGSGTVGLNALQVARLLGARVIVADVDEARLERAKSFGADRVVHSPSENLAEAMASENEGFGPSVVIDGAGIPALLEEACRLAAPAARIVVLGFSPAPCNVSQQEIVKKELTLVGSRLNRRLLPEVVDWLASGRLDPEGLITGVFPARRAADAFRLVEEHPDRVIKVQLDFD